MNKERIAQINNIIRRKPLDDSVMEIDELRGVAKLLLKELLKVEEQNKNHCDVYVDIEVIIVIQRATLKQLQLRIELLEEHNHG